MPLHSSHTPTHQICLDLGYFSPQIYDENQHVYVGPGALSGLSILMDDKKVTQSTTVKTIHKVCRKKLNEHTEKMHQLNERKKHRASVKSVVEFAESFAERATTVETSSHLQAMFNAQQHRH